jgi:hypothetical protein
MKNNKNNLWQILFFIDFVFMSAFAGVGYYLTSAYQNNFFQVISYGVSAITMAMFSYLYFRKQKKEMINNG